MMGLRALVTIAVLFATSAAALGATRPADMPGAATYRQRCQSCHAEDGRGSAMAPALKGVVGRRAASTAFNYSPALKQSGMVWSKANLDRYISAPGRLIPGTRMVVSVTDPKQRAELIDYLAAVR